MVLAAGLMLAGAATPPAAKPPSQSERLQQRIDALLKHRQKPEALPVILPNPFEVVSGGATGRRGEGTEAEMPAAEDADSTAKAAAETPADAPPPGSNAEALARCAARLRIGGMVTLKGQLQIIVNDFPRKEGDVIVLDRNNAMTYLQVVHVAPGELTLRLNEATQTIRF